MVKHLILAMPVPYRLLLLYIVNFFSFLSLIYFFLIL